MQNILNILQGWLVDASPGTALDRQFLQASFKVILEKENHSSRFAIARFVDPLQWRLQNPLSESMPAWRTWLNGVTSQEIVNLNHSVGWTKQVFQGRNHTGDINQVHNSLNNGLKFLKAATLFPKVYLLATRNVVGDAILAAFRQWLDVVNVHFLKLNGATRIETSSLKSHIDCPPQFLIRCRNDGFWGNLICC